MFKNYLSYIFRGTNDPEIQRLLSASHGARMDESRKARTRALLQEYMEMRPIRKEQAIRIQGSRWNMLVLQRMYAIPIMAIVLAFGMTAGTAFAAEGTLPGDLLYPVKVHVTEEVKAALLTSPQAQADWQVARAAKRLEEASTLAVQGRITDQNKAEIETNLADHVARAEKSATALVANDDYVAADEIGAHLHAVLRAHGDILASVLPEVDQSSGASSAALLADVIGHLDSAALISTMSEAAMASSTADIASNTALQQSATESHLASVRSYIDMSASRGDMAPELVARAKARLADAEHSYAQGEADLQGGATTTALAHFTEALGTALDAEASLSAQSHLLTLSLKLAANDTAQEDNAPSSSHPSDDGASVRKPAATIHTMTVLTKPQATTTSISAASEQTGESQPRASAIRTVIGVLLHGSASSSDMRGDGSKNDTSSGDMKDSQENKNTTEGRNATPSLDGGSDEQIHLGL